MKPILILTCLLGWSAAFCQSADSARFFFLKANEERKQGRQLMAYTDLTASLRLDSGNADGWKMLGETAMAMNHYDDAAKAFVRLARLRKDDTTAIANLATLNFYLRRWPEAISYANRAIQLHAGKNNFYILGKSYYELEDYGHAFSYLPTAAADDPKNPEIPYIIARSYVDMSNYKPAVGYFQKAIALDSTKNQWMYECALAMATVYNDTGAIRYYQLASDHGYHKDNDYYENVADSYIAIKQPEKALTIMQDLLSRKPGDLEILNSLGYVNYRMKKYDPAIEYWDRILTYDKDNSHALYMIGMAYQKKGDTQKGRQLCDKAIEMDPSLRSLKTEKRLEQ